LFNESIRFKRLTEIDGAKVWQDKTQTRLLVTYFRLKFIYCRLLSENMGF